MAANVRAARPAEGGNLADAATLAIEHDHEHPDLAMCQAATDLRRYPRRAGRGCGRPRRRSARSAVRDGGVRGLVGILVERTLQDDLSIRRRSRSTGLRLS